MTPAQRIGHALSRIAATSRAAEAAGLSRRQAGIGAPLESVEIPARVWLHRDRIRFAYGEPQHVDIHGQGVTLAHWRNDLTRRAVSLRTLLSFTALRDATPMDVLRFAETWGPLGLCLRHGLPYAHGPRCSLHRVREPGVELFWTFEERIEDWHRWALRMHTVFDAAQSLHDGAESVHVDYLFLTGSTDRPDPAHVDIMRPLSTRRLGLLNKRQAAWTLLAGIVNLWLGSAQIMPILYVETDSRPEIRLGDAGGEQPFLFGCLAVQLLVAVTGRGERTATCSNAECGRIYVVERKPQAGRRHYCDRPECRRTAANRDAARDRRAGIRTFNKAEPSKASGSSPRASATRKPAKGKRRGRATRKA